jgi:F420-non-reducing hydrogenase small subunit
MAVRTALEWLGSCSGCEIAFLNIGEDLVSLLTDHLEIVHAPFFMDHKYYGQCGDKRKKPQIPKAVIGIISGGVSNEEHIEILHEMRDKCTTIIALGSCATQGGIPALMNGQDAGASFDAVYQTSSTDPGSSRPDQIVPKMLDRTYALDEKIKIDLQLAGCPPNPQHIAEIIMSLLEKREPELPSKSVCDTCPTVRKGKGQVNTVKRFVENATFDPEKPISTMRCLLEQGYMCMGPVTAAGCARHGAPACIEARVPCRGCFSSVRPKGSQLLDMMNALASNGIDYTSVIDRRSIQRFCGAHNNLRPKKTIMKKGGR